jgi:D-alanyl-D-alanine carboxypeptidase/D-alanyl-D-alanine-endopeptidase (penicillin-binding protein 4)
VTARRPPSVSPVLVLVVLAMLPAVALFVLWQWSSDKAESADEPPPTSSTIVAPPPPAPAMTTAIASMRRFPTALSRDLNLEAFEVDVQPLLDSVNDRSCVSLSVDGYEVGARNEDLQVIPASVQKILVAAGALEVLGPDFRYVTTVRGAAPVDGVVTGDLYLVGGGDPLLSGDWYATSNLERFPVFNATRLDDLADALVTTGVTRVDGAVLGDGSRYDDEFYAPGWGTGVAGLESGPYDALMANDSRVLGDDLRASDPNEAAARELVRMLGERGVTVAGGAGTGTAPAEAGELAAVSSAPLTDVIAEMLTNSDNNTSELMVKEIGVAASGTGTREAGLAAVLGVLGSWGIDTSQLVLADGSGLSLDNRMTCRALVDVLRRSGVGGPIGTGLPVAGQTGTLSEAFVGTEVEGTLRGKTGTLNNPPFNADPPAVKSLAGFEPVDGGGAVEFALLLNGPTISDQSEYRPIWDLLATTLASYPSAAGPDVLGPR